MKTETFHSDMENKILLSMITDPLVLAKLTHLWDGKVGPLSTPQANLIGSWCIRHFNKYSTSPNSALRHYFDKWTQKNRSEAETALMEQHLSWLSSKSWEDTPEMSSQQMIDEAADYIDSVKIRKLIELLTADMAVGDINKSRERLSTFVKTEIGEDESEEAFCDIELDAVFDTPEKSLITFDGDGISNPDLHGLKKFFMNELSPNHLIAFQAPEKGGKSFMLVEMAVQALLSRKRVAFFEVGDMSKRQVKIRFLTRIAECPYTSPDMIWPCKIRLPIGLQRPDEGEVIAKAQYTIREFPDPLDKEKARTAWANFMEKKVGSKNSYLKLRVFPNFTCTVPMIAAKLFAWKLAGWVPEVVIIDYADLLLSTSPHKDFRHSVNQTWGELRKLSQEHHCLVLTATQADAESYRAETQDRRNFSEDKRKNSHVNGIVGINMTGKEREAGVMRLNWILGRDVPWSYKRFCYLATCLPLANPAVMSIF